MSWVCVILYNIFLDVSIFKLGPTFCKRSCKAVQGRIEEAHTHTYTRGRKNGQQKGSGNLCEDRKTVTYRNPLFVYTEKVYRHHLFSWCICLFCKSVCTMLRQNQHNTCNFIILVSKQLICCYHRNQVQVQHVEH